MSIDTSMDKGDAVYLHLYLYLYIHTHARCNTTQPLKGEIMPSAATWMDLAIITVSKASLKEKDRYHMIPLICGISNMTQMNLPMKQKQTHRHKEETCGCQGGGAGGGCTGSLGLADTKYYV